MSASPAEPDPRRLGGAPERFERQGAAVPEVVPAIRRNLSAYAAVVGAPNGVIDAIASATSEAMTNVIRHAYERQLPGPMRVTAYAESHELVVVVEDEGVGRSAELDGPGGLGLAIITGLCEAVEVSTRPDGSGTRVLMRFGW